MQNARQERHAKQTQQSANESLKLATATHKILSEAEIKNLAKQGDDSHPTPITTHFAEVDRGALQTAGFIAPDEESHVLADEYRQIKRPLIANAFGKRAAKVESGRLIMVASALPGDGKTFTCINLALSIAQEQDRSVLLVDADVAKSHLSSLFNLHDHQGLLDLVEDPNQRLQDVLVGTDVERLTLLPSGKYRSQATELLASERMEDVVKMLIADDPNRIVLFDSPPLLITTESQELASLMGQIVVIVRAGVTPTDAIQDAVASLDPSKAINLVLNQVRGKGNTGYWGSYHGYGSAYRRESTEPSEALNGGSPE